MAQVLTINGKLALQSNGLVVFAPPTNPTQELAALINYDISNSSSYSGSGTALTDIGTEPAMNATLYNGVGYSSEKGGVLTFDGTNDYGLIPYNAAMNSTSFSVLTWFCITTFPERSQYRILTRQAENSYGNNWGYQMGRGDYGLGGTSSDILMFMHANGSSAPKNLVGNTRLALNTWYHGGFTTDGTTHRIYLNGTLDGQTTALGSLAPTDWPISLGALAYDNTFHFPGKIGQAKFFNIALTPEQVAQEFEATKTRFGFTTLEIGKVVDYSIDTTSSYPGSGTTVYDISGSANTNNGTLVNGVGYSSAYGGVLTFDGIDDYVVLASETSINLSAGSVLIWWKPTSWTPSGHGEYFWCCGGTPQSGGTFNWLGAHPSYSKNLSFGVYHPEGPQGHRIAAHTSAPTPGVWHHVVASWGAFGIKIAVNGYFTGNNSNASFQICKDDIMMIAEYLGVGGSSSTGSPCEIGSFKIVDRALTDAEVLAEFNTTKARFGL